MNKRIYLCLAHMSGKEQMYIKEAFDTNWVVPLGPNVNGFEKDLEEFVGEGKHVVALSAPQELQRGTDARPYLRTGALTPSGRRTGRCPPPSMRWTGS